MWQREESEKFLSTKSINKLHPKFSENNIEKTQVTLKWPNIHKFHRAAQNAFLEKSVFSVFRRKTSLGAPALSQA